MNKESRPYGRSRQHVQPNFFYLLGRYHFKLKKATISMHHTHVSISILDDFWVKASETHLDF